MKGKLSEPELTLKVTIKHDARNKIKISVGAADKATDTSPKHNKIFSCFNYRGGENYMKGGSGESDKTIEIGLDASNFLEANEELEKIFLRVTSKGGAGEVVSFSLIDYTTGNKIEIPYPETNMPINPGSNMFSVIRDLDYEGVNIATESLPGAKVNEPYSFQLQAEGGKPPYVWNLDMGNYTLTDDFEGKAASFSGSTLSPSDNDDGVASLSLPFSFPFYGQNYNKVYVSTDGSILFSNKFEYIRSASELAGFKAISILGADYIFNYGDEITTASDNNSVTIRWKTSNMFEKDNVFFDFQTKLYKNGEIECYYSDISGGIDEMVIGTSDGNGKKNIADISNTSQLPANSKFKFYPPSVPEGMTFSSDGVLSGTPVEDNREWPLKITLTDSYNTSVTGNFIFSTKPSSINNIADMNILLKQNYPNPFNPVTTINYSVLTKSISSQNINLSVYNAGGQLVKTLVNKKHEAGNYSVKFDGSDLNSGIYYYRLNTPVKTLTNKMLLVK